MSTKPLSHAAIAFCIALVACTPAPPATITTIQPLTPTIMPTPITVEGCAADPIDLQKYGGADFENPDVIASQGKVLDATLEVKYADNQIATCRVHLRSYNGQLVGPTLRAKPGDKLIIHIKNMLPPNPHGDHQDMNDPHDFNTTNLHTHGLHVSPNEISDNVLRLMPPAEGSKEAVYDVIINIPEAHPTGTFWYHPHVHGSTAMQVSSGMAGALIIEDPRKGLDSVPAIRAAEEQIFVFQQIAYDTEGQIKDFNTSLGFQQWQKLHRQHTINGQLYPKLTMQPGEVQRWRWIHAGVAETIMATIYGPGPDNLADVEAITKLPVNKLHEIAEDGLTLGKIDDWSQIELQPGYRSDILAKFEKEGTYYLIDNATDGDTSLSGGHEPEKLLARIEVTGQAKPMQLPEESALAGLRPFKDITDNEITGYQTVVFCMCYDPTKKKPVFTVNGKAFDETPRVLQLNAVEEWEVSTDYNSIAPSHPFHIHVNPFQFVRLGPDGKREIVWKDTLLIRQGTPQKLRMRYEDFTGRFVMHCHILDHEDQGMMQLIQVVQ